jgi:hypothetical protein
VYCPTWRLRALVDLQTLRAFHGVFLADLPTLQLRLDQQAESRDAETEIYTAPLSDSGSDWGLHSTSCQHGRIGFGGIASMGVWAATACSVRHAKAGGCNTAAAAILNHHRFPSTQHGIEETRLRLGMRGT